MNLVIGDWGLGIGNGKIDGEEGGEGGEGEEGVEIIVIKLLTYNS